MCCVTLVCLAPASAIVGAVECTMTLTAAPIPGIIELGFDVTDSITVLVWSLRHVVKLSTLDVCSRMLPVLLFLQCYLICSAKMTSV